MRDVDSLAIKPIAKTRSIVITEAGSRAIGRPSREIELHKHEAIFSTEQGRFLIFRPEIKP